MCDQRGFTLLELLIAAAIIATLAVFATQSFRRSASEVRLQDAQARAKVVAMAAHRLMVEYPSASFSTNNMGRVSSPNRAQCVTNQTGLTLQTLIDCGYLDYRQYAAEVREEGTEELKSNFKMFFPSANSYKVCVQGITDKILDKRCYCTYGEKIEAPTDTCS